MPDGIVGTVDWVGYSVGEPSASASGFIGVVDFTGIPSGVSEEEVSGPSLQMCILLGQ